MTFEAKLSPEEIAEIRAADVRRANEVTRDMIPIYSGLTALSTVYGGGVAAVIGASLTSTFLTATGSGVVALGVIGVAEGVSRWMNTYPKP